MADSKSYFTGYGDFISLMNSGRDPRILCLMKQDQLDELVQAGLKKFKILKKDFGKVLISNA